MSPPIHESELLFSHPTHTILVVEDDVMVRRALTMLLEAHGFHVVGAADGADGLVRFGEVNPDLVLTDIYMPEKDGLGMITEMRRVHPDAKIIAMSGGGRFGTMDFLPAAVRLGADYALRKPFDNHQLVEAIRGLLGRGPSTMAAPAVDAVPAAK